MMYVIDSNVALKWVLYVPEHHPSGRTSLTPRSVISVCTPVSF